MSLRPCALPEVPKQTASVARAAFAGGTLAMRIRDELGEVFVDEAFLDAFAVRGRPGISPGQLAMVTVLQAMADRTAPGWLWYIPAVRVLRQIWVQQYTLDESGRQVIWRDARTHGLPPGRTTMLLSPYDTDARHREKRGRGWTGYKVHLTKTCDNTDTGQDGAQDAAQPPNLIINVATTHAAVDDSSMTVPIHQALAEQELLPAEHLMDAGYASAAHLVDCRTRHRVRLVSPVRGDHSHQARARNGYQRDAFTIDVDTRKATCPQGAVSTM